MRRDTAMRVAAVAAVLLALAAVAGGGSAPDASGGLELRLLVRDASGRSATRFGPGDAVDLVLELRNAGADPLRLEFATARTHDFAVLDEDSREVWRWSRGRLFAQALSRIELAPGETRRFAAPWDQRDASGAPARPGRYRAVATLACMPSPRPADPVLIEIE